MKESVMGTAKEVGRWALIGGALTTAWAFLQQAIPVALIESVKLAAIPGLQIGALVGAAIGLMNIIGKATSSPATPAKA